MKHSNVPQLRAMFGGKCKDCGASTNLHFHHRNPKTKKFTIASRHTSPPSTLIAEARKCDLLCASCHRSKHPKAEPKPRWMWKHKTVSSYVRGCRCDPCRWAMSRYSHRRRLALKASLPPQEPKPPKPMLHGAVASYWRGCRCDPCRLALREYSRARSARNYKAAPLRKCGCGLRGRHRIACGAVTA